MRTIFQDCDDNRTGKNLLGRMTGNDAPRRILTFLLVAALL